MPLITKIDIGCGSPEQKYKDCYGIDISKKYNPDLVHDCNEGLPFKDEQLDFINSDNSLEHFPNAYYVLKECYRCLDYYGTMRLVVPSGSYFPFRIIGLCMDVMRFWNWWMSTPWKKERGLHYQLFTKALIILWANTVGFKIQSVKSKKLGKEIELILVKR